MLTPGSLERLLLAKGGTLPDAIRIVADDSVDLPDLRTVPLLSTVQLLIERAHANGGLKLTATGNLSRVDVRALFDVLSWPDYNKAMVLTVNKVLNEPDVWPVEISRVVAQEAKLLRRRQGLLHSTKLASLLIASTSGLTLMRLVTATLLWRINLGYVDRVPVEGWPQDHVGIVLWCLSVSADRWSTAADLVEICTLFDPRFGAYGYDHRGYALESRVLRPLTWLGLMESQESSETDSLGVRKPRLYRKTPLFDRLLIFDVRLNDMPVARH